MDELNAAANGQHDDVASAPPACATDTRLDGESLTGPGRPPRGKARGARRRGPELGLVQILNIPIAEIRPSPENLKVYRPVTTDDPEIIKLAESIRKDGVLDPLVITADRYILSGHRRWVAARLAGLKTVPCRVEPIRSADDPDRFLVLLTEYNIQREKSLDEKLNEEIVAADPGQAYESLLSHRALRARPKVAGMTVVCGTRRAKISSAKEPFLAAIQKVIAELEDFWPVTVRQIHYRLLNYPPLTHASKPESTYANNQSCYRALAELLTRARVAGRIPMHVIADETRPVTVWDVCRDPQPFLRREFEDLFRGYSRDLLQSQPCHIEIIAEKNTIAPVIEPVAMEYCIPMTIGRGFCSLPPRYKMAERFRRSGKDTMTVLIVSDFDPDGEQIAQSLVYSLRRDFAIKGINPIKVALTKEQTQTFDLPPGMKAKKASTNYEKFNALYGDDVYELEALAPNDLQAILRETIESVLDVDAYNAEVDQEKKDAAFLENTRRRGLAAMGNQATGE